MKKKLVNQVIIICFICIFITSGSIVTSKAKESSGKSLEYIDPYHKDQVDKSSPSAGITDPVLLEALLNSNYNVIDDDMISQSELNVIDLYLYFWGQGIKDLNGLEHLIKAKGLYLSGNKISDITPLKDLTNLMNLDLSDNYLDTSSTSETMKIIKNLENNGVRVNYKNQKKIPDKNSPSANIKDKKLLEVLNNFDYNGDCDISQSELNVITQTYLYCWGGIRDISGLEYYTNLESLYIRQNNITDISPLLKLKKLRKVDLSDNYIDFSNGSTNLEVLKQLETKGVEVVNNNQKQVPDPNSPSAGIRDKALLEELIQYDFNGNNDLSQAEMKEIGPRINLVNKGIKNIQGLEYATDLKSIDLENNMIKDISPLVNLSNLSYLYVRDNPITNFNQFTNLKNIRAISITLNMLDIINHTDVMKQIEYIEKNLNRKVFFFSPKQDVNNDWCINLYDVRKITRYYNQYWKRGDINNDGTINIYDLVSTSTTIGEWEKYRNNN